jgi:beta-glucanase (GH16 family)
LTNNLQTGYRSLVTGYFIIIVLPFSFLCLSCNENPDEPENKGNEVYPGYTLAWNDEFSGASLDLSKWNYETGTGVNGDFGTGQIDYATNRAENVSIQEGLSNADGKCLVITTREENFGGRSYTSGRINSSGKGEWGTGHRIEARIWARDVLYKGQGFAFWMMPGDIPAGYNYLMWPQGGEIDIMEFIGSIPYHNLGSVHYAWRWENNQWVEGNHGHQGGYYNYGLQEVPAGNPQYGGYPPAPGDANAGSSGFHIYGIEWFSDRIQFYIDNILYHIHYFNDGSAFDAGIADGQDEAVNRIINGKRVHVSEYSNHFIEWKPFENNFFIILSAGVGGDDNRTYGGAIIPEAVFPCSVIIDWVRVYRKGEQ